MLDFTRYEGLLKLLLESIQRFSPYLERLVLFDTQEWWRSERRKPCTQSNNTKVQSEFSDFVLQFTLKMKHLTALCIFSPSHQLLDGQLMEEIRSRIEENVVPLRPSLWVCMNDNPAEASLPDAPAAHYNEMIDPSFYFPTPPF